MKGLGGGRICVFKPAWIHKCLAEACQGVWLAPIEVLPGLSQMFQDYHCLIAGACSCPLKRRLQARCDRRVQDMKEMGVLAR